MTINISFMTFSIRWIVSVLILLSLLLLVSVITCELPTTFTENPPETDSDYNLQILDIIVSPLTVGAGQTATISALASGNYCDQLSYSWSSNEGSFPQGNSGYTVEWSAPADSGDYTITLVVSDSTKSAIMDKAINVTDIYTSVSGTVVGLNNNPIEDVTVSIGNYSVRSNSDGYFTLENIPVGFQLLKASKSEYFDWSYVIKILTGMYDINMYLRNSPAEITDEETMVIFSHDGGGFFPPGNSVYNELRIKFDGNSVYFEMDMINYEQTINLKMGNLSSGEIDSLKIMFCSNQFFLMDDEYPTSATDGGTTFITYRPYADVPEIKKRVVIEDSAEIPDGLRIILNKFRSIINTMLEER